MKEIFWISHSPIHQEEYQDLCQRSGAPLLIRPMEPESLEEQLHLRGSRVESLVVNLPLPKAAQVFRTAAGPLSGPVPGLPEDRHRAQGPRLLQRAAGRRVRKAVCGLAQAAPLRRGGASRRPALPSPRVWPCLSLAVPPPALPAGPGRSPGRLPGQ